MKKQLLRNKKAEFNFFIEDKYVAGLCLQGWQVKAILANKCNIENGYVVIRDGEVYMTGMQITPLTSTQNQFIKTTLNGQYDIKLLLNKKEINKLIGAVNTKGYTLVPLNLFIADNNKLKMTIALAKGKKEYDKKETIKQRDLAKLEKTIY